MSDPTYTVELTLGELARLTVAVEDRIGVLKQAVDRGQGRDDEETIKRRRRWLAEAESALAKLNDLTKSS